MAASRLPSSHWQERRRRNQTAPGDLSSENCAEGINQSDLWLSQVSPCGRTRAIVTGVTRPSRLLLLRVPFRRCLRRDALLRVGGEEGNRLTEDMATILLRRREPESSLRCQPLRYSASGPADEGCYGAPSAAFATAMAMKYGFALNGAGNPFVITATAMSWFDR